MLHYNSQLHTIRLNDYDTLFHFEIESHADFGPLVSKDHKLYQKMHVDCVSSEHTGWSAFSYQIRKVLSFPRPTS
jgi:hypothetical protein